MEGALERHHSAAESRRWQKKKSWFRPLTEPAFNATTTKPSHHSTFHHYSDLSKSHTTPYPTLRYPRNKHTNCTTSSLHHYFPPIKSTFSSTPYHSRHFNLIMLSHHTLNPNAQPFYLKPKQQQQQLLYFPPPICYYFPPSPFGFYPSFHAPTSNPSQDNTKTHSLRSKVWAKGNWSCHHKFYTRRVRGRKLVEKGTAVRPFPTTVKEATNSSITTVMIRNVPNQFKFDDLLHILDEHCLRQNKSLVDPKEWSKFDFVYLPMDYRKHAIEKRVSNLGYAFVNFTTPKAAFRFYREFQGLEWDVARNKKICEINVAQYQGKDTLIRIFQPKVFRCASRHFLPVLFSEGRHGLNHRLKGTYVGNHVWGLPRRTIGTCAFDQNV